MKPFFSRITKKPSPRRRGRGRRGPPLATGRRTGTVGAPARHAAGRSRLFPLRGWRCNVSLGAWKATAALRRSAVLGVAVLLALTPAVSPGPRSAGQVLDLSLLVAPDLPCTWSGGNAPVV